MKSKDNSAKQCLSYQEDLFHSAFVLAKVSVPCYGDLTKRVTCEVLDSYCDDGIHEVPIVLVGAGGAGKTTVLADWITNRKSKKKPEKECLFYHFAGCSRNSISVEHTLRRIMWEIKKAFDLVLTIHPSDERLAGDFPHFLQAASKKGRLFIILDGIHRIIGKDEETGIRWLPQVYPKNVHVILSLTLPSFQYEQTDISAHNIDTCDFLHRQEIKEAHKILYEMKRRTWTIVEVGVFNECQVSSVLNEFEWIADKMKKKINTSNFDVGNTLTIPCHIKARILSNPGALNPIYLATFVRSVVYASFLGYLPEMYWERLSFPFSTQALIQSVMDIFESNAVDERNPIAVLDPLLGRALILLYVSRHGLYKHELQDILTRLHINDRNKLDVKSRLDTLKTRISIKLFKDKQRLIDIFRTFDKDRNGVLSSEELLLGFRQLDIDVDKELVDVFFADVDKNGDNKIDYREAIEGLERQCRQVFHGSVTVDLANAVDSTQLSSEHFVKLNFDSLFQKLFCLGVISVGSNVLSLPLENSELRMAISSRYIDAKQEEKWRLFLVNYFSEQSPSLRRSEELLWHLCKSRQFPSLKHNILDLRTFDIMLNDDLFKGELGDYLAVLTRTGADNQPFDLVRELSNAIDYWYQGSRPSAQRLNAMINQISCFLQWFDDTYTIPNLNPCMMRTEINACFERIGDKDGVKGFDLRTLRIGESIDMYVKVKLEQSTQSISYLLDRWIWIQIPWILIRACEVAATVEGFISSPLEINSGNIETEVPANQAAGNQNAPVARLNVAHPKKRRHLSVGKTAERNEHMNIAKSTERMSKKSANFQKVERLKSEITHQTIGGRTSLDSEKNKATGVIDELARSNEKNAENCTSSNNGYFELQETEELYHPSNGFSISLTEMQDSSFSKRLEFFRELHDGLALELEEKKQKLSYLLHSYAQEELGNKQNATYLKVCAERIRSLQIRNGQVSQSLNYVTRLGELFEAVESRLAICDPSADKKRLKSLENNIVLSEKQASDMMKQLNTECEEKEHITQKVMPKLKNQLARLRCQREEIETKAESIRRVLSPETEKIIISERSESSDQLDTLGTALKQRVLTSFRHVPQKGTMLITSTSNVADVIDKIVTDSSCSKHETVNALHKLLERTGKRTIGEAVDQIASIHEVVKSHSNLKDSLADEICRLKLQLKETYVRLESIQIGAISSLNAVQNDVLPSLTTPDEPIREEKESKSMGELNQLIHNIRTGVGHVNKMLLGLKLEMGSILARICSHVSDVNEDARRLRQSGFLLQHVIDKLKIGNDELCRNRRASINTQLAAKQLALVEGPKSFRLRKFADTVEKTQRKGPAFQKLTKVKLALSGKEEVRVKTLKEADKQFECEMRQLSVKHENDSHMQGISDSGRYTSEEDMLKFLSGALNTGESRKEQRTIQNRGFVLQKVMKDFNRM